MSTSLPANPNVGVQFHKDALRTICLAGGCFWGTEAFLARIPGVAHTTCVYANGKIPFPTYEQVCREHTGHAEAVLVQYDPQMLSLEKLLRGFFRSINPTTKNRQGGDMGSQYRSGIYYEDPSEVASIRAIIAEIQHQYSQPIATEVLPLTCCYPAENYRQRYLEKNPGGYCHVDFVKL